MPQLIALALLGASAVAGYKWLSRQMAAVKAAQEAEAARASSDTAAGEHPKDLGALTWDPANGVYRPVRRT